jgi:hypothetical protein
MLGVSIILVIAAGPHTVNSQSPTAQVGGLAGSLPPGATRGGLTGILPPGAARGGLTGILPPGAARGGLTGVLPPDAARGGLTGILPPDATRGGLTGILSPGASRGGLTGSLPPGVRFTDQPLPFEAANGLEGLAKIYLLRGASAHSESALRRSEEILTQELGPEHPDVAQALEDHAALLRKAKREGAATEREARAESIRAKLRQEGENQ